VLLKLETPMTAYQILAVGPDGKVIALGTVDTAVRALASLIEAQRDHPRAWVVDENNFDVSPENLMRLANTGNSDA
jgi:hypothetical protein